MNDVPAKFAFVDIGNSWIKYCVVDHLSDPLPPVKRERWAGEFELEITPEPHDWFIASVSRPGREKMQQVLQARPHDRCLDLNYRDLNLKTAVDYPEKTGIDRFCAARGAIDFVRASGEPSPIIVADIGTAVTVDAIDTNDCFVGGTIFLGPVKSLQELCEQTDALPDVSEFQMVSKSDAIGRNTTDAMKAGVIFSLVGGIKEIVARQTRQLGEPVVVVTGGGAPYVKSFIPENWRVIDDLVLRGIQAATRDIHRSKIPIGWSDGE